MLAGIEEAGIVAQRIRRQRDSVQGAAGCEEGRKEGGLVRRQGGPREGRE